jgi:hypothetical protein
MKSMKEAHEFLSDKVKGITGEIVRAYRQEHGSRDLKLNNEHSEHSIVDEHC